MSNFLWTVIFGICPISRVSDSFSSTFAITYQHSTSYKGISVPMTCLDCKSLLGNTRITEHNTRSIYGWPTITVDQSKVLKYRLFRFLGGHPDLGSLKIIWHSLDSVQSEQRLNLYTSITRCYLSPVICVNHTPIIGISFTRRRWTECSITRLLALKSNR